MIASAPRSWQRFWRPPGPGGLPAPSRVVRGVPFLLGAAALVSTFRLGGALTTRLEAASDPAPVAQTSGLPALFTPEVQRWSPEIEAWAAAYHLPPALIATVMQIESCGDSGAQSGAGALGLFQVMPFHFAPGEAALDPDTNARRGLSYLARALELAGGRVDLALAGYNGGHSRIAQLPVEWPEETRRYVTWGTSIYGDAVEGRSESQALAAWLSAGGARLCLAASHTDA